MTARLANLRRAMASTPWAILEDKFGAILDVVEHHASGQGYTPEQLQAIDASIQARQARMSNVMPAGGKIAVISMYGTISQRSSMFSSMSGGCSAEDLGAALDQAMADPNVGAIVIDCDSPGGTVSGVPELAARLFSMRGQGKKIVAVANSLMASAAYWICSAADEIVVTPSGDVGSIGVFGVHTDVSQADAQEGITRTLIRAGKYKAESNPFQPLSDEARSAMQASVDDMYAMFTADVAKHRGTTADAVQNGYGEGRVLSAKRAVAAGLADRVDTLEGVLANLGAPNAGMSGRSARATAPALPLAATTEGRIELVAGDIDLAALTPGAITRTAMEHDDHLPTREAEPASAIRLIPVTAPAATGTNSTADGEVGASTSGAPNSPESTEHTMDPKNTGAPPSGGGAATADPVAVERARASEIRLLGREHSIPEDRIDAVVDAGASVDAAGRQFLTIAREARSSSPTIRVGANRETSRPWENFGEQCQAIISAMSPGRAAESPDVRLFGAAQGMNQQVPSEGGFLVAPQFSTAIWDGLNAEPDNLLAMTDNYTVEGESLSFNANGETSRATGSRFGGVQGYWINEADQLTKSKPKFRNLKLEPQQLGVLVYLTEKLMRNAGVALGQYVTRAATEEIMFLVSNAIFRGSGVGQPQGLLNSGSTITVTKETSQAADTIQQENISKMWARLHPRAKKNAVWLLNSDCEPQLDFLNTVVKNVAGTENVGGYANKVYDAEKRTLKNRPIITCEYSESIGDLGDLMLVDLGMYATGTRGGVESAMSMHLRFDYAEQVLRFLFEVDGQSWLAAPLTPFKGSNTQSGCVILQAR